MQKLANVNMQGSLFTKVHKTKVDAPLSWRVRNKTRPGYVWGTLSNAAAKALSRITGIPTLTAELRAVITKADGSQIDLGVLGRRVVTDAFVDFMVDQLQAETSEWGDFKFHDSGVGTTAENVTDVAIETTDGEARVSGTQAEGASSNIYQSVGTINYTTTKAITEHMLFSHLTAGTGLDRTVFTAINVNNGDAITFTYELTVNSGG